MGIELSERLETIGSLVPKDSVICDIGCDHALLPIALVSRGICKNAIAMDVNEGPLNGAGENVRMHLLSDKIELRLSDGFLALQPTETNVSVIAGMGGLLMLDILKKGRDVWSTQDAIILSPHRDEVMVREYMAALCHYDTDVWVEEDGHFYCVMRFLPKVATFEKLTERQRLFGINPTGEYLSHKKRGLLSLLKKIGEVPETDDIIKKKKEIQKSLEIMEESNEGI